MQISTATVWEIFVYLNNLEVPAEGDMVRHDGTSRSKSPPPSLSHCILRTVPTSAI